ncbi:hypothetical protein ACQY0O_000101 [Thecaphora frezii]
MANVGEALCRANNRSCWCPQPIQRPTQPDSARAIPSPPVIAAPPFDPPPSDLLHLPTTHQPSGAIRAGRPISAHNPVPTTHRLDSLRHRPNAPPSAPGSASPCCAGYPLPTASYPRGHSARIAMRPLFLLLLSCLVALASLGRALCRASPSDDVVQRRGLQPSNAQLVFDGSAVAGPPFAHVEPAGEPHTSSINLIDLLTSSRDHNILLRLLQRTRLVPTLNRLQQLDNGRGITILAPTDEAFLKKRDQQQTARIASTNQRADAKGIWEWLLLQVDDIFDTASTDDAAAVQWIWKDGDISVRDNVNAVARQHLLYHVLNYTLPYNLTNHTGTHKPDAPLPDVGKPAIHETMHFPSRRLLREPTRPGHIPRPDEEDHGGLIGDEGQKIRVATIEVEIEAEPETETKAAARGGGSFRKHPRIAKALVFGTDSRGQGGARSLHENWSSPFGVIHTIDEVLDLPPSLEVVLETHPSLEKLRTLLTPDLVKTLSTTAHLSLFLPTSEAFAALSDLEWVFLNGKWQQSFQDRLKVMGWHMSGVGVGGGKPAYAARLRRNGNRNITTVLGGQLAVEIKDDDAIYVDGGKLVEEDILTENGVVHLIDRMILPFGDLDMTVEKYLLALNATKFVQLFHDAGLEDYIQRPPRSKPGKEAFTFLAPRDDVIDEWMRFHHRSAALETEQRLDWIDSHGDGDGDGKTPTLQEVVKYHVLPGLVRPKDLTDGMLLGTELRDWKLRQGRQRIPVQVDDEAASRRQGNGDVGFGDANVLREPVEVKGSAVIYIISQLLEPPSNPIQTAVSRLALSTFVATVFSAELKKAVQRAPGITYLIPTNDAFAGLGLAMGYLLLPESQAQLQALIEFHSVDRIVYLEDFQREPIELPTLLPSAESKVVAERLKNGTVLVSRAGQWGREPAARIIKGDILTNTGVIHEIDRVGMPLDLTIVSGWPGLFVVAGLIAPVATKGNVVLTASFNLLRFRSPPRLAPSLRFDLHRTQRNLMQGAKADTMGDLIQLAGYGWIVNGSSPNNASHHRDSDRSYVVLVPTDNAFTRVNLSSILEDPVALQRLVEQHIIPLDPEDHVGVDDILPDGRRNRLTISDTQSFATLLDQSMGGPSRYGRLSFRRIDDAEQGLGLGASAGHDDHPGGASGDGETGLGYLVGITGTRGTDGSARGHSAQVLKFGRESRALGTRSKLRPGIGGVVVIDTVLEPYQPGWLYRWGWVVLASAAAALVTSFATLAAYRWWTRDGKIRLPDALEGEEE